MGTRLVIDRTTVYEIDEECMACSRKGKMSDAGDRNSCYTVTKVLCSRQPETEKPDRG